MGGRGVHGWQASESAAIVKTNARVRRVSAGRPDVPAGRRQVSGIRGSYCNNYLHTARFPLWFRHVKLHAFKVLIASRALDWGRRLFALSLAHALPRWGVPPTRACRAEVLPRTFAAPCSPKSGRSGWGSCRSARRVCLALAPVEPPAPWLPRLPWPSWPRPPAAVQRWVESSLASAVEASKTASASVNTPSTARCQKSFENHRSGRCFHRICLV